MHRLTLEEIADIDNALQITFKKGHTSCGTMAQADFPLHTFKSTLEFMLDRVENDMGMFVLRGFPIDDYSEDQIRMIYWGIGLHLGGAVSQSGKGDVIGDVKNFAASENSHTSKGRGYMTNERLSFHTDSCDIVSLIVLQTAPEGGLSMICSSIAVRNEIARRRPDLLEVLYGDFYWSWKGNQPPGTKCKWYKQPVFSEQNGRLSCRYISMHIHSAQEFSEVPRLTDKQKEALELVDDIANEKEMHFEMMFEPGDIQVLNNHICMHARTEFVDGETDDTKRHLLRMWLSPTNSRQLNAACGFFLNHASGELRGGFWSHTGKFLYQTPAVDL